jgi:alpha-glucosidase
MRVLLTIQAPSAGADISSLARFWLNRGVAGLHIATSAGTNPEQTQAIVQAVRKQASSAPGQRIVISDLDLAPPDAAPAARHAAAIRVSRTADTAQLQIDSRPTSLATLDAASLRPFLTQTIAQPNLLLDLRASDSSTNSPAARPPLAEVIATIALITHPAALIDASADLVLEPTLEQPKVAEEPAKPAPPPPAPAPAPPPGTYLPYVPYVPPPKPKQAEAPRPKPVDPLTGWYRSLAALHHDNAVLLTDSKTFLDFDAQNTLVWVNRPAAPSPLNPPVVVLCNLSSSQVQLSLTAAMKSMDLHGFFLRALLRSDNGMGAQDLDSVTLPPFSVYIGELRR